MYTELRLYLNLDVQNSYSDKLSVGANGFMQGELSLSQKYLTGKGGSMILNSGETNVKNIPAFELGNSYSEFDIVYYSGYTDDAEYPATQAVSGHYYYTGTTATSTTSNLPTTTDGPWTNKFFATPSYGAEVNYKTLYYEAESMEMDTIFDG